MSELGKLEFYVHRKTLGLWLIVIACVVALFFPLPEINRSLVQGIFFGCVFGIGWSLILIYRHKRLRKEPYLTLDADKIECLPIMGKPWSVPTDSIDSLELNDTFLSIQRSSGGKKYLVAIKILSDEDRAKLANYVNIWNQQLQPSEQ